MDSFIEFRTLRAFADAANFSALFPSSSSFSSSRLYLSHGGDATQFRRVFTLLEKSNARQQ